MRLTPNLEYWFEKPVNKVFRKNKGEKNDKKNETWKVQN